MTATARPDAADPPLTPGPRTRSLIALVLRLGLGIHLLNVGLTGFLFLTMQGGGPPGRAGVYPGTEGSLMYLPYLQIVIGLALVLGFLTNVAAALAAVVALAPGVAEMVVLLTIGSSMNPYARSDSFLMSIVSGGGAANVLLTVAVIWFSQPAVNAWSLDALMFARRANPPRPKAKGPAPDPLGGVWRELPDDGRDGPAAAFDPDLALEREPGGRRPDAGP
jgi:uncharacterized membrane protein YphA (DoxX/SURF4 family)